jgi:hypothetical protein
MKTIKIRDYSELPTDFTGIVKYTSGTKVWYRNGKRHRTDGPAIEHFDGTKQWYWNGKQHRTDGPAYEDADDTKVWYLNGQRHRVDGPAYESVNGLKQWNLNDELVYELKPLGDYILIEEGLPSEFQWLGEQVTQRKVLTEKGFMYIPNLPGI